MASLKLLDTGYLTASRSGTPSSTKMNSGSAVDLTNTARIRMRWGSNIESDPHPASGESVAANFVSFSNRRFDIEMTLTKTSAADQVIIKHLAGVKGDSSTYPGVITTDGLKLLYISGVADTRKTAVELVGQTGTLFHGNELTAGLPMIIGRVENINLEDSPNTDKIVIKMTFVEAEDAS